MIKAIDDFGNYLSTELGKQKIVQAILHLILILYIARVAPAPPDNVLKIFENVYFKLFFLVLILWSAKHSASTAILVSVVFLMITNYTTTGKIWEFMENTASAPAKTETTVSTPESAIKVLANAALSPEKSNVESVAKVADIAMSGVTTTESSQAVTALAQQAVVQEAGDLEKVKEAVATALGGVETKQDPVTGCYPPRSFINMDKIEPISEFQDNFGEFSK